MYRGGIVFSSLGGTAAAEVAREMCADMREVSPLLGHAFRGK